MRRFASTSWTRRQAAARKRQPNLTLAVVLCAVAVCSAPSTAASGFRAASGSPSIGGLLVSVDVAHPGVVIPSNFLGLSLETPVLRSGAVSSTAPSLSRLLRDLGSGVLRISGDSVDRTQWLPSPATPPAPWSAATVTPADLANLGAITHATGWQLILGLNLGHPSEPAIVEEARAATSALGVSLAGLEIGNEPDLYTRPVPAPFRSLLGDTALRGRGWGFTEYQREIASLRSALLGAGVSAPLYGPDTAGGAWLESYAADERPGLAGLTTHFYPFDRCHDGRVVTPGPSVASLLSRGLAGRESRQIRGFVQAAVSHGLPLRIDETNSVACGGQSGTSDTFAAALWALDYSLIAAREGVAGLNFHGGLGSCQRGGTILSPWYSPLCTLPNGQLYARAEYYALLLLRSLEDCAFVPVSYRTSRDISVYALRAADGTLRVVVDDMETPATARSTAGGRPPAPVSVTLHVDESYQRASVVRLSAPSVDATQGVTLGGASLRPDGSFPQPAPGRVVGGSGRFVLQVRPGSAALVTLAA
jgi:Glycosyl hydrolase family 79 C-terminal beta domain